MICKKCKTAVAEGAKKCANCGKPIRNLSLQIVAIISIVVVLAVCFIPDVRDFISDALGIKTAEKSNAPNVNLSDDYAVPPSPADAEQEDQGVPVVTEDVTVPPPSGVELNAQDEVVDISIEVAKAAQDYYDRNSITREFATQNGHLYDVPAKRYVEITNLVKSAGLQEEYENKSIFLLYVKQRDLEKYEDFKVEGDLDELTILAACETPEGFVLSSSSGSGGFITRAQTYELLDKYNGFDYGVPIRLKGTSQKASDIETVLAEYMEIVSGLDVRFLVCDAKYAFAVISPKGDSSQIKEFILVNTDGTWEVGLADFEAVKYQKALVTNKFPDFSVALFPAYNLYYHLKYVTSDFRAVMLAMEQEGIISETDEEPVFICGNDEAVYMELVSGEKYVLCYDRSTQIWDAFLVKGYTDAEAVLNDKISEPPFFIVKQY